MTTWSDRLALATAIVDHQARHDCPYPPWLNDQIKAASADTETLMHRTSILVRTLMPDERWSPVKAAQPSRDQEIHVLAAMLGLTKVCPHLRDGGPQPAIVRLALYRVDCRRCSQTFRKPPPGEDDRCDVCGKRGVATSSPCSCHPSRT